MDGITVNGLPILIRPSLTVRELDRYYAECVTGGPGSFVLPIKQASEFATAIRRKLILEVSGTPVKRADHPGTGERSLIDCERGERERQAVFRSVLSAAGQIAVRAASAARVFRRRRPASGP